jgi:DnaJ-class molecular chaperone
MDYYSTLGLTRGANTDDIKKAYRSLAMKHHPDRGGDEKKFKEISQAYEYLTDPQKKSIIDLGGDPNSQGGGSHHHGQGNPFEFHFGTEDLNDLFGNFGFGGRPQRRNRSLSINVEINLEEVLTGKELNAGVGIPGGNKKMINIEIPPGIQHGQQIKYQGMGDHSMPDLRPGDLIVNVFIRPNSTFRREGNNLIFEKSITVWDAILGAKIAINTLDNKNLHITIPPGTQPDTVMSCNGEGLPDMRTKHRGNLLIRIKVNVPRNLTHDQYQKIQELKNGV